MRKDRDLLCEKRVNEITKLQKKIKIGKLVEIYWGGRGGGGHMNKIANSQKKDNIRK